MYIISETLAGNDPRFKPLMERIYSHWEYTSYYVPDGTDVSDLVDGIAAVQVTEDIARSLKFGNVNNGKIGIRTGTLAHEEVFGESTEPDGEKTYYFITSDDENNLISAYKEEMKLYLNEHFSKISSADAEKWASKKTQVTQEINECTSVDACRRLMHTRFGLDSLKGAADSLGPAKFDLSDPGRDNYS
jgi:hypothetical protein